MINSISGLRNPEFEAGRSSKIRHKCARAISDKLGAVWAKAKSLGRDEAGTVVMYVVAVPVFAGMVAAGAETGNFYRVKRQMQNAADAAALSASIDSMAGNTGSMVTDAKFEAQRNGFTDGANNITVTVNSPPASGPNVSTPGAVEVIIKKSSQSFVFGKALNAFLGQSSNPFTLTTRSVAAQGTYTKTATTTVPTYSSEGCIVALTPNAEQGISLTSFNNFTADCSIMSNGSSTASNSSASIYMASFNNMNLAKGSGSSNAQIWTRGSLYATSYNSMTPKANQALINQTATINDPYASRPAPSPSACNNVVIPSSGSSLTLKPGTYCGGLTISSFNNVYFEPGTYYIANGDLYITSVNNVSCPDCTTTSDGAVQGVTFVLTQTTGNNSNIGGVKITSQNNITLNAPNLIASQKYQQSGPQFSYPGLLFYQDRNAPVGTMTSTSKIFTVSSLNNATLSGAIYFPNNRIDISSLNNSSPSANGCTVWIGRYIKFSSYNNNYTAGCQTYSTSLPGIPTGTTTQTTSTPVTTTRVVE